MTEILSFDNADILISDITGESLSAGRARELTRFGILNILFPYEGKIGLFRRLPIIGNTISTASLFPIPEVICDFNGLLQSVLIPSLDEKIERIVNLPGTKKFISAWATEDTLKPHEILLVHTHHMHPTMPAQPPEGFYWGRVQPAKYTNGGQVIQPAMLDRSPVPESAKRLSSDEIRALFEKVKTGTVAPEQEVTTPAPVVAGKKWTPEKVAELKAYREKYGTAKASVNFKITTGYIRQLLPTRKPKPKGYSAFAHLIKDA